MREVVDFWIATLVSLCISSAVACVLATIYVLL